LPPPEGASRALRDMLARAPVPTALPPPTTLAGLNATIAQADAAREAQTLEFAREAGVTFAPQEIAGVKVTRLTPPRIAPEHAHHLFVHLHGGGFIVGAGLAGLLEAVRIAAFLKIPVLSIDYRMPPDHPAPAAMDDVAAVWSQLCGARPAEAIVLGGSSAGATLALVAALRMKELGLMLPAALFLGTPVVDLAKRGDMRFINDGVDRTLVRWNQVAYPIALYVGEHSYDDPHISPIYGTFDGFPPAYVVSGTRDLMLSDAVRVHRKLRQAGVDADLHVYEGLAHAEYALLDGTPEQREHHAELNAFIVRHLGR
jgi:acetyl esterase/lipase